MNNNKRMFFYGIKANLVQLGGVVVFLSSIFIGGLISLNYGYIGMVMGLIGVAVGIGLFVYGKSMRFDYQRQSGSIIHRGDW